MKKFVNKKKSDTDDRVISPMDVDGMPWYSGSRDSSRKNSEQNISDTHIVDTHISEPPELTKKETMAIILNAVGAGLLIAAILIITLILFVLFCSKIWLK